MEVMERMVARLFRAETKTLATKDDVKGIRDKTFDNANRIDKVCEVVSDLRRQIGEVRYSRATATTTAAGSTSSASSTPRLVQVCGFAH